MKYKRVFLLAVCCFFFLQTTVSAGDKLNLVIRAYELAPSDCQKDVQPYQSTLVELGKHLFETKVLSGDRDTSCATCHLEKLEFTDGLALSIGVGGGDALSKEREKTAGIVVARNSFTLRERAHKDFSAYFWDGKVQTNGTAIVSQIASRANEKFDSVLAVTSIIPILARDEFLGKAHLLDSSKNYSSVDNKYYEERYDAANRILADLMISPRNSEERELVAKVKEAGISIQEFELSDVGNALASFIAKDINCHPSTWQKYLSGDKTALTNDQKKGALLFFGKGRCAYCHSGNLFSDFKYHSIATPQGAFKNSTSNRISSSFLMSMYPSISSLAERIWPYL